MILAIASLALLVQRTAIAGDRLTTDSWGAVVARFDMAVPVVIALVAFVAARRSLSGRSAVERGLAWIPATYVAWALTILFAKAALHVPASPRRLLTTLIFFRDTGVPLPGLGAGPLLLTLVLTVALMPVLVGLSRRTRPWAVPACLVVIALVYRSICTATGNTDLFGPLSWLPNHLDLVGVGLAIALIDAAVGDAVVRRRLRLGGLGVAVISFGVAAFALGLPKSPLVVSPTDVHVYAVVALVFAAGVLCASSLIPPAFTRLSAPRLCRVLAVIAPGVLLAGGPAFTLVARQYHERVFEFDGGVFLRGNLVAPFIWSLLIASAFGVVIVATVGAIDLARHGEWRAIVRSRLALPTVVALGYFVRVITLLTVLPERTDNGDPLFYHTTANVLARGRGFIEPLRWRDFEMYRPERVSRPPVSGRAVDQFAIRGDELLRPQDDVDRHRHRGRVGGRHPRQAPRWPGRRRSRCRVRGRISQPVADRQSAVPRRADGPAGDSDDDSRLSLARSTTARDSRSLRCGDRARCPRARRRDPAAAAARRPVDPADENLARVRCDGATWR